jgi:4-hydroxy-2-oxoheptanedioate aldolase
MASPEFCEIASAAGMDFVIVDMEHGSFGIDVAVNMIRAVQLGGAAPFVRVPSADRVHIFKALDAGAHAVLVPNVDTPEMAAEIVQASHHSPRGNRGACPCTRANAHGVMEWKSYLTHSQETVKVAVLIETPLGIQNFEKIVAVPGIDIVALGPFDLSQAMGLDGDWKHPDVQRKQAELVGIARDKGVHVMMSVFDSDPDSLREQCDRWQAIGADMIAVSGDRFMLSTGFKGIVSALSNGGSTPAQP